MNLCNDFLFTSSQWIVIIEEPYTFDPIIHTKYEEKEKTCSKKITKQGNNKI